MTNPDNAIGTNAAYDGRTSVNAFNDDLASYSAGILSGWDCVPNTGLTVSLGGGSDRDVAIAEDNNGNKTTINNISGSAVDVTMPAAPASNTRIDLVVAYVDNPPQGNSTTADNPDACGIIPVSGTPSATPVKPTDNMIRTAITADGASGTTAYYVVLAQITITTGTTDITSGNIVAGTNAYLNVNQIQDASITASKLDFTTMTGNYSTNEQATPYKWINGKTIYKKTIDTGQLPDNGTSTTLHGISNLEYVVKFEATALSISNKIWRPIPYVDSAVMTVYCTTTSVNIYTTFNASIYSNSTVTLYYTKSS